MRVTPRTGFRIGQCPGWRIAVTAMITFGVLTWAPGALAEAYPDEPTTYVAPECDAGAAPATVYIDAGTVTNSTTLDLSADGGAGIGDASGGDENLATTGIGDDKDHHGKHDKKDKNDRDKEDVDTSAAGNGGIAGAGADGGAIAVEDVNSGGNVGSAIAVGDTWGGGYDACGNALGGVSISGGEVINETTISVSADGGTAIADASGGDRNIASNGGHAGNGGTIVSIAGNGGVANASANGGAISIGNVNSGGNAGNAIAVGDTVVSPGAVPVCCAPPPPPSSPVLPGKPAPAPVVVPGKVTVVRLPSTGTGAGWPIDPLAASALLALVAGFTGAALRRRTI